MIFTSTTSPGQNFADRFCRLAGTCCGIGQVSKQPPAAPAAAEGGTGIEPRDHPQVIERLETPRGELVLRRRGAHYEIISNGVFLMATYNGRSERLLAEKALAAARRPRRVLVGGLGVGFTLAAALDHLGVEQVTVVEVEPAVIAWQGRHLAPWSANALADPRVQVVTADLIDWLAAAPAQSFEAALIDIDNGPGWTVTTTNDRLYGDGGLATMRRTLADGGVAAFWSAAGDENFRLRLTRCFTRVIVHTVPVDRGMPDVIYVAAAD